MISLGIALAITFSRGLAWASPSAFDECATRLGANAVELARCFYEVARQQKGSWVEAERRLQRLSDDHPRDPWPLIYLGHVHWFLEEADTEDIYRRSIEISDLHGSQTASVEARVALLRPLILKNDLDEAGRLLLEARKIAAEDGARQLLARVTIAEASLDEYRSSDLDHAFHRLKELEPDVFPAGSDALLSSEALKRAWLGTMIRIGYSLERNRELGSLLRRQLTMARESGDLPSEVAALYGLGVLHLTTRLPTPEAKEEARLLFEEVLDAAITAPHKAMESFARLELGKLSAGRVGREHLRTCCSLRNEMTYSLCLWALASNLLEEDPDSAEVPGLIGEALAATAEAGEPFWSNYGWEAILPVQWATLPRPEAIQRSLDLIDSIETLRDSQASGSGRAGLLARWIGPYYWLSGRLLEDSANSPDRRADLGLAFTITERMRARVLLEALEAARASSPPPETEPLMAELEEILDRKVAIQHRWVDPRLDPKERAELRELLDDVEQKEGAVRQRIERAYPASTISRSRDFASLGEIEEALGDDEAMLSFQLALDEDFYGGFAGGSWLLAITRSGTRSYRLPGLVYLEERLENLLGLVDPEDGIKGYVSLYRDLMAAAIDDLPASIDKLTIIADGQLHRLPFSLLRESKDAEPLVTRFQLSMVPSAKLWLRWRKAPPVSFQKPALVFADPELPEELESEEATESRNWDLDRGMTLGRLPYAGREGRAVVCILGGGSRLLKGPDASEDLAKSEEDLRPFGVLHFAAHALIDEQNPQRSAVYLARGDQGDGLLQPWEIVELDLDGQVIVLASCRTAIGEMVRGEGPMSLARAFFRAKAPVVVAGLWQLPDAGTSEVIERFYRHLARGTSVAEAMALAQRAMIRDEAPGREWAGLVVLGDGSMVPFPGGLPRPIPCRLIPTIGLALVLLAGIVIWRRSLQK